MSNIELKYSHSDVINDEGNVFFGNSGGAIRNRIFFTPSSDLMLANYESHKKGVLTSKIFGISENGKKLSRDEAMARLSELQHIDMEACEYVPVIVV